MTSPFSSVQWQSCLADVPLIALPAMRCLLCGYSCEHECARASVQFCAWCRGDASTMHAEEMEALHRLANISPAFSVWSAGRRQDVPVSQPAKIFPGLPLYVGDMDDAANIPHLLTLGIPMRCQPLRRRAHSCGVCQPSSRARHRGHPSADPRRGRCSWL